MTYAHAKVEAVAPSLGDDAFTRKHIFDIDPVPSTSYAPTKFEVAAFNALEMHLQVNT